MSQVDHVPFDELSELQRILLTHSSPEKKFESHVFRVLEKATESLGVEILEQEGKECEKDLYLEGRVSSNPDFVLIRSDEQAKIIVDAKYYRTTLDLKSIYKGLKDAVVHGACQVVLILRQEFDDHDHRIVSRSGQAFCDTIQGNGTIVQVLYDSDLEIITKLNDLIRETFHLKVDGEIDERFNRPEPITSVETTLSFENVLAMFESGGKRKHRKKQTESGPSGDQDQEKQTLITQPSLDDQLMREYRDVIELSDHDQILEKLKQMITDHDHLFKKYRSKDGTVAKHLGHRPRFETGSLRIWGVKIRQRDRRPSQSATSINYGFLEYDQYVEGLQAAAIQVLEEIKKENREIQVESISPNDDSISPNDDSIPSSDESIPPNDESIPPSDESIPPNDDSTPQSDESISPSDESISPSDESVPPSDDSISPNDESIPPNDDSIPQRDSKL